MNTELNKMILTFKDKGLEREYTLFNDYKNRHFLRIGKLFCLISWIITLVDYLIRKPSNYELSIYAVSINIAIVTAAIMITYISKAVRLYQPVIAFAVMTSMVFTIAQFLFDTADFNIVSSGAILLILFSYLVLLLRFKIALLNTVLISCGLLITIIIKNLSSLDPSHVYPVFLAAVSCTFGGYLLEKNARRIYIQDKVIDQQTRELNNEKERSERLLLNVLPKEIAQRLKDNETSIADNFNNVTILFADIVDFTNLSARLGPKEIVNLLNSVFTEFDTLVDKYNVEKIKTIGDAYMVVAGLPQPRTDHAKVMADFALDMMNMLENSKYGFGIKINIRVGINSGPVVAGVIGKRKFLYDLWGDTVNTASRMESHGIPGEIQISEATQTLIKDYYVFKNRGLIDIKGKGQMKAYLLSKRIG